MTLPDSATHFRDAQSGNRVCLGFVPRRLRPFIANGDSPANGGRTTSDNIKNGHYVQRAPASENCSPTTSGSTRKLLRRSISSARRSRTPIVDDEELTLSPGTSSCTEYSALSITGSRRVRAYLCCSPLLRSHHRTEHAQVGDARTIGGRRQFGDRVAARRTGALWRVSPGVEVA